jgi:predicted nucleic acid-binding protein
MDNYVLDTSALITFIENEEGADTIESILLKAIEKLATVYISVATSIELFYISLQEQGMGVAEERITLLENLPITVLDISYEDMKIIGTLKANYKISFADSCIAAIAKLNSAILVHKDPEYNQLDTEVKQLKLPFKHKQSL